MLEKILQFIAQNKEASTKELLSLTGFSRTYLNRLLNQLIQEKKILRLGQTNRTHYVLFDEKILEEASQVWRKDLINQNLSEDQVFRDFKNTSSLLVDVPQTTVNILEYAFTEMLNNAIDHSGSTKIAVEFKKESGNIIFSVRDFGVGVFNNIMKFHGLKNEYEAIQDLLKGKQTTAREFHSGEGIFFTSKIADVFSLASEQTELRIDNNINDIFIVPQRREHGTKVVFTIGIMSNKKLTDVFARFADVDSGFTKTEIQVKLYNLDTVFISRSQARRLLAGLEKFKEIVLDFAKVETVGQGFADEIFRVYQNAHLDKKISYINAIPEIEFMIKRVG